MQICKWLYEADKYFMNEKKDPALITHNAKYESKEFQRKLIDEAYEILNNIPDYETKERFIERKKLFTDWIAE